MSNGSDCELPRLLLEQREGRNFDFLAVGFAVDTVAVCVASTIRLNGEKDSTILTRYSMVEFPPVGIARRLRHRSAHGGRME